MSSDTSFTEAQVKEMTDSINNQEPVPVGMIITAEGFQFITDSLMILNKEKYRIEQGIQIANKGSVLSKWEARVLYSDSSSKIISLREEK